MIDEEGDLSVYRRLDQLREEAEIQAVVDNIIHRKWRKRQRDEYRDEVAELFDRNESDEGINTLKAFKKVRTLNCFFVLQMMLH